MSSCSEFSTLYKTVIAEIRPRLQSVNVFAILQENNAGECTVQLCNGGFDVTYGDHRGTITLDSVTAIKQSLTSLDARENFIVFRFNIESDKKYGCFNNQVFEIARAVKVLANLQLSPCRPNLDYDLRCVNCSRTLCRARFDRILPLPSDSCEPNEWFCHAHDSESINKQENIHTFLHADTYFHLGFDLISDEVERGEKCVTCKKCCAWLGTDVGDNVTKLWFHTVSLHAENLEPHQTNPFDDVLVTLRACVADAPSLVPKIVLTCQKSDQQKEYVLLWVIDKSLKVCIMRGNSDITDKSVYKVLYKRTTDWTGLVERWHDFQSTVLDVSKPMMDGIVKELNAMNLLIPEKYGISDGLHLSYLDIM